MKFADLPLDLVNAILTVYIDTKTIRAVCLVNKIFNAYASPVLYDTISIYPWNTHVVQKAMGVFETLAISPLLASYVHKLEIRAFPKKAIQSEAHYLVVEKGLRNCHNLVSFAWTRDNLITSILQAVATHTTLQEIEINGFSRMNYSPSELLQFTHLKKVTIIMPSRDVVAIFQPWFLQTGSTLSSLTLVCKSSPVVTDTVLEHISSSLTTLENLYLTGCTKVTHNGIWSLLRHNSRGLSSLGLEGLSPSFNQDMDEFERLCSHSSTLTSLKSITLTIPSHSNFGYWVDAVIRLLSRAKLETFRIYSSEVLFFWPEPSDFWVRLVEMHKSSLRRISIHRVLIDSEYIENICRSCTHLEELFLVVRRDSVETVAQHMALSSNLQRVHINSPLQFDDSSDKLPDAARIVQRCGPSIVQFGYNTKVWKVERKVDYNERGNTVISRNLLPYDGQGIPEQFLVVRV